MKSATTMTKQTTTTTDERRRRGAAGSLSITSTMFVARRTEFTEVYIDEMRTTRGSSSVANRATYKQVGAG